MSNNFYITRNEDFNVERYSEHETADFIVGEMVRRFGKDAFPAEELEFPKKIEEAYNACFKDGELSEEEFYGISGKFYESAIYRKFQNCWKVCRLYWNLHSNKDDDHTLFSQFDIMQESVHFCGTPEDVFDDVIDNVRNEVTARCLNVTTDKVDGIVREAIADYIEYGNHDHALLMSDIVEKIEDAEEELEACND